MAKEGEATGDPIPHSLHGHGGGGQGHVLALDQETVHLPPAAAAIPAPGPDQDLAHDLALPRLETGGATGAGVPAGRGAHPVGHGLALPHVTEVLVHGHGHLFGGAQDAPAHLPTVFLAGPGEWRMRIE